MKRHWVKDGTVRFLYRICNQRLGGRCVINFSFLFQNIPFKFTRTDWFFVTVVYFRLLSRYLILACQVTEAKWKSSVCKASESNKETDVNNLVTRLCTSKFYIKRIFNGSTMRCPSQWQCWRPYRRGPVEHCCDCIIQRLSSVCFVLAERFWCAGKFQSSSKYIRDSYFESSVKLLSEKHTWSKFWPAWLTSK